MVIENNLPLIKSIAKKYHHSSIPQEDREQMGVFWMIKAINNFDSKKWIQFSTYAYRNIYESIQHDTIHEGKNIRIPVHAQKKLTQILKKITKYEQKKWRATQLAEQAHFCELTIEAVTTILEDYHLHASIDAPVPSWVNTSWEHDKSCSLGEILPWNNIAWHEIIYAEQISQVIQTLLWDLKSHEQAIVIWKNYYDRDGKTLWKILDMDSKKITRIYSNVKRKMKDGLNKKWIDLDSLYTP